ncbi:SGNH/GDSL hydrolase family protein [Legionella sp.]|uniref:SGNH/GDSL hydrolase family protein n=1 Tax=Legionella sp. TaxID=459 RepID=UPI003C9E2A11
MPTSHPKINICNLIFLGDSLSDRGTFYKRKLFDFIPLKYLYVKGYRSSPRERFTNGFVWGDYVCAAIIEEYEIDAQRKKRKLGQNSSANADISDAILINESQSRQKNEEAFSLNDDRHILYNGKRFARFYCEAGLTSYDYTTKLTIDLVEEGARLTVTNLESKRKLLIQDDKKYKIDAIEKYETLVVEWSGANDLLTVNKKPSLMAANNAVNSRIENLEILIKNGYRNFVLFNLPDLSLTPRYQVKSKEEQEVARQCSIYFNEQLANKMQQLQKKYQNLNLPVRLSIFDVNSHFKEIYDNPKKYNLDENKLKFSYLDSEEFKQNQKNSAEKGEHISPSTDYMFWDGIHPSMRIHSLLAEKFEETYNPIFKFIESDSVPYAHFPVKVLKILDDIYLNAMSMEKSSKSERQRKGELLKQFNSGLKCKSGNLQEMHLYIKSFIENTEHMNLLKKHNNPIFDFFAGIKTTRSEDYFKTLIKMIEEEDKNISQEKSFVIHG